MLMQGRFVIENEKGSIGSLQRHFKIGFNRAGRIMDQLAGAKVVGPELGTKPRKVEMTMEEFETLLKQSSNVSNIYYKIRRLMYEAFRDIKNMFRK